MEVSNDLNEVFCERVEFSEVLFLATSALLNEDVLEKILYENERNKLKELLENINLQGLQELAEYIAYHSVRFE